MGERGSVLALLPASVLVFMVLGAIAVDGSLTFLAERQVSNLAAAVANDAAAQGVDVERFHDGLGVALDEARVQAVVDSAQASAATSLAHLDAIAIDADVVGDEVLVSVTARSRSLFSRALPASVEWRDVGATARAVARRG